MKSYSLKTRFFPAVALILSIGFMASLANAQGLNEIPWMNNVEQAKRLAQQENKIVLLHFGASWCRPCRALDTYVFNSATVKRAIAENAVPVKLDADVAVDLVNEYDVSSVPYDVMITPGGRVISERRSPAESDNYAKMIASVASASRQLEKEKLGPIAHQNEIMKKASPPPRQRTSVLAALKSMSSNFLRVGSKCNDDRTPRWSVARTTQSEKRTLGSMLPTQAKLLAKTRSPPRWAVRHLPSTICNETNFSAAIENGWHHLSKLVVRNQNGSSTNVTLKRFQRINRTTESSPSEELSLPMATAEKSLLAWATSIQI